MKKIITLTLNPALDKTISIGQLIPDKKIKSKYAQVQPGGGGVNVSRAMHQLGVETKAVFLSGGYTGKYFEELLSKQNISFKALPIKEDTRENFVVVDDSVNKQYRFGMDGPTVTETEWQQALQYISAEESIQYIIASGSLPPGVPTDIFAKLAVIAKQKNAKLVVDTSGDALKQAVQEGLYLIKPNIDELSNLYGKEKLAPEEILTAARNIIAQHGCEIMVVSMGKEGAMLVTKDKDLEIKPPPVTVNSTVGAGDSMVAGMLVALHRGWELEDVLRYGIAAGTAATMNHGTDLCKKDDTERLFAKLKEQ